MRLSRTILNSRLGGAVLAGLAAAYIRLVHATGRWAVRGDAAPRRLWAARRPFIVCFWHGRMLMMPCAWPAAAPVKVMISGHRDGRLIAGAMSRFGVGAITGSSHRRAVTALRECLREIAAGTAICITPDGPRGPRMRAQAGAIAIARRAGVPIFPASCAASRRRILGSWDRFLLPLPFARGVYLWGAPIEVAREADAAAVESARQALEDELNALTREADRLCGQTTVEPAGGGGR